jgi:hypothetical protein
MNSNNSPSKYSENQYKGYMELQQSLKECYSRAEVCQVTQPELSEMKKNLVFKTKRFQKLSSFYRGRITGYDEALWNNLQENLLEYRFCYYSRTNRKTIVSEYENLPKYIRAKQLFTGVHYWKGTLKSFTIEPNL